jgi:hypothetical protein
MQMRIRIECGLDSGSRAGFWPNDRAGVRAVRTIQGGKNEVRIRFENMRYVCKGWAKIYPALALRPSRLFCFPLCFIPLSILHFERRAGLSL